MSISAHVHRARRLALTGALALGLVAIPAASADPLGDACGARPADAAALPAYHTCALGVAMWLGREMNAPRAVPYDPAPVRAQSRAFFDAVAAALDGPNASAAEVLRQVLPPGSVAPGPGAVVRSVAPARSLVRVETGTTAPGSSAGATIALGAITLGALRAPSDAAVSAAATILVPGGVARAATAFLTGLQGA